MKKIAIGIDIGGTNTPFGLVDEQGNLLDSGKIPTPKENDPEKFVSDLAEAIKDLLAKQTEEFECLGIGIGAPNANYYSGCIEHAANLAFKGVVPLVQMMRKHFDYKAISLTNDANAATIGEMVYGGAKGMKNFVMITLGTGVGSGIVVNNELVYGNDGFAGELGHLTIVPNGRLCGCGQRGHLETYCSASGMTRTAFELLIQNNDTESVLAKYSYSELTSKNIHDAALQGDAIAIEVFNTTGKTLGRALADIVCFSSPEAIFLFGGPTAAGNLLFDPIIEAMEQNLMPIFRGKVKILPSKLSLGNVAILGASALVFKELNLI